MTKTFLKIKDNTVLKQSIIISFIFGFVAHGYAFSNFNPSHDSLVELMGFQFHKVTLGRFLAPVYQMIFSPNIYSIPWINGLFGILWLSLIVYFLTDIFQIKGTYPIILMSGIMVTNLTVVAVSATYMHDFGCQMLSYMLAVLACRNLSHFSNKGKEAICFIFLIIDLYIALALYQASVSVYISLVILWTIFEMMHYCNNIDQYKNGLKNCFIGATALGISGILYYLSLEPACKIFGVSLTNGTYNSVTNLGTNPEPIWTRLKATITDICHAYFKMPGYIVNDAVPKIINILLLLCSVVIVIFWFIRINNKKEYIRNIIFTAFLILIYPFGINCIRVLNQHVHLLMVYSYWIGFYLTPLILMDTFIHPLKKENHDLIEPFRNLKSQIIFQVFIIFLLVAVFLLNISTANIVYLKKDIENTATLSLMTRILDRIEKFDDYVPGSTPVVFSGLPNEYFSDIVEFKGIKTITGLGDESPITYDGVYQFYFSRLLKRSVHVFPTPNSDIRAYMEKMPSFPARDSIQLVNGFILVKL